MKTHTKTGMPVLEAELASDTMTSMLVKLTQDPTFFSEYALKLVDDNPGFAFLCTALSEALSRNMELLPPEHHKFMLFQTILSVYMLLEKQELKYMEG